LTGKPVQDPTKIAEAKATESKGAKAGGEASIGDAGGGGADKQKVAEVPKKPLVDPVVYEAINNKIAAGDVAGAEKDLTALVDKQPDDGKAWLMLGGIQEQKGEMAQAKVSYRQAQAFNADGANDALRQIDSSRVKPLVDKASEQISGGDMVKAAATLKQAIQMAPELPELHRKLQTVLDKLGDKEASERERKKADELEKPPKEKE
ncbi:MAG: hypothetical protein K2X64_10180, partial [Rhodocyclaceae bacterium]|nr:hypothetical protein [Rhodocyclaceae bacterium]